MRIENNGQVNIKNLPAGADTDSYVTADASGNLRTKSSSSPTYAIGDFCQGGVVFWVSPSGEHGKVVSIYDATDIQWSNITNTEIGASAESDINGAGNTVAIVMQSGHTNSAAQHCADLAYGGYDDWYIPSKNELNDVYLNRVAINTTALTHGGEVFASAFYWSSSEFDDNDAWEQNFFSGFQFNLSKSTNNRVRAIRAF